MAKVAILMGSDSDLAIMKDAAQILKQFEVEYEVAILSAHRLPKETTNFALGAEKRGIKVIIAGAGGAAHLAGVIAANTTIPVIGVPIMSTAMGGVDALYSTVQMPKGVPVATVAINGAANAGLLAISILALGDPGLSRKIKEYRAKLAEEVRNKGMRLVDLGIEGYMLQKGGNKK
ncbi:MAG: 5-(carboxyamino)imidazole ribonucleotide mutase [Syntrophomonadales bacterium]